MQALSCVNYRWITDRECARKRNRILWSARGGGTAGIKTTHVHGICALVMSREENQRSGLLGKSKHVEKATFAHDLCFSQVSRHFQLAK